MRKALRAWDRFWFTTRSTSTAAVVRIAGGLVLLAWAVALGRDVLSFFGPEGILPKAPDYRAAGLKGIWGLLGSTPSPAVVIVVYVALVVGAVCLVVGFHSRFAALVVFATVVSFTRRNPTVFNSGDALLRVLTFFLVLVPGGAALSVDRWRRTRKTGEDFWQPPVGAVWPLRLMQVQLSVAYLAAAWAKVGGVTWREGSAVTYALRVGFIRRLPLPHSVTQSLLLSNVASYATLATELALGLLVWNRRLRRRVLLVGVAFHLILDYAFRVGFFSYGMFVFYLAFVPPETMDTWLSRARDKLGHRRAGRRPGGGADEGDVSTGSGAAAEAEGADSVAAPARAGALAGSDPSPRLAGG